MKVGKRIGSALLAVALVLGLMGCQKKEEKETFVLKIGAVEAADDIVIKSLQKAADLTKERTNGAVEIQVFPASQLGDFSAMIEAVKMGTLDMVSGSGSYMSEVIPDKMVETMFFLFEDEEHFLNYLESDVTKAYSQKFTEETGIKVLSK